MNQNLKPFRETGESGNALDPIPGHVEFDDSNMPAGNDPGILSAWANLDSVPQNTGSVIQWGSAGVTQIFGMTVSTGERPFPWVGWLIWNSAFQPS